MTAAARSLRLDGSGVRRRVADLRWADRWLVAAVCIYLGSAILLTWPMSEHISTQLYGTGGDAFGAIGDMQQVLNSHVNPFLPGTLSGIGAPEGRPWDYAVTLATVAAFLPRWIASLVFGVVPAWNLYVLLGYLLTGSAMFLLVRRLTGSLIAALVAGWAYAFFPFADVNGEAHVDFIQNWVLILIVWRGLELRSASSRRNALLLSGAVVLALLWTPYFWLYTFAIVGTVLVIDLISAWRARAVAARVSNWVIVAVPPGLVLIVLALVNHTFRTGAGAVPAEGLGDFYTYGARPLDYLIPIPGSGLFSGLNIGPNFAGSYASGYAMGERGIYVGWTVLALAAVGLVVVLRAAWVDRRIKASVLTIGAIGVVAFVFSGIPTWRPFGLFTIYMPTWFFAHVTTAWRVFARFVEVVELALCVLLGFALAAIARDKRRWIAVPLLVVVSGLVVKDLWWQPATTTIALPNNPVYRALGREHDQSIAAQYPIMFDIWPDYAYTLATDVTHHRLLNGAYADTTEEMRDMWLGALNNSATAGELTRLGVHWVMINELQGQQLSSQGIVPSPGTPGRGYTLVTNREGWQLWRVTAPPAFGQAYPFTGFLRPGEQGTQGFLAAWLGVTDGTIEVEASDCNTGCRAILRFQTASYGRARTITLRYGGRVIAHVQSPVGALATVSIPVHLRGSKESIAVSQSPAAQLARSATGQVTGGPYGIEIGNPVLLRRSARR